MKSVIRSPYSKFLGVVLAVVALAWGTVAQAPLLLVGA